MDNVGESAYLKAKEVEEQISDLSDIVNDIANGGVDATAREDLAELATNKDTATDGQVLTSNGDGTATFEAPTGGSSVNIINDLTTGGTLDALSAEQGKELKGLVDGLCPTPIADDSATPAFGSVANGGFYRATNASLSAAPTLTIAAIASTAARFETCVSFKAPNATPPVVTNNSGYTIKYQGADVSNGTWTPVANTVYRMSFSFDGIYLNCYITGVS